MARHVDETASTARATMAELQHKRRVTWLIVTAVVAVAYLWGVGDGWTYGFVFKHLQELILTTGIIKFVGE